MKGFRAPYFMAPPQLFPLLAREGFTYDSSLSTFFPGRYFNPTRKRPFRKDGIWELPMPDFTPLGGPPAGFSYYRLFHPLSRAFRKPYMVYLHPYEFLKPPRDTGMRPAIRAAIARNSGERAWALFEELLGDDHWVTCAEYLKRHARP